jgi:amyloid beta precursor protein binding protein 1
VLGRDIPQISIDSDASTLKTIRNELGVPDSLIPIFIAMQILDSTRTGDLRARLLTNSRSIRPSQQSQDTFRVAIPQSSLTGGLVAQEALKVLTRQYGPLDNTCVFDGARSKSEMYRL